MSSAQSQKQVQGQWQDMQPDVMKQLVEQSMNTRFKSCECQFNTDDDKKQAIAQFLRENGDYLPEEAIMKNVEELKNWKILCDCNNKEKIISSGKWERSDWYLCTIKNLATHPDYRKRGLSTQVTAELMKDAIDDGCLVLAMDITKTNVASMTVAEKRGFKAVNEFCYGEGQAPAKVMHWVRYAPIEGNKCIINKEE